VAHRAIWTPQDAPPGALTPPESES
jgi:hypothetical protein